VKQISSYKEITVSTVTDKKSATTSASNSKQKNNIVTNPNKKEKTRIFHMYRPHYTRQDFLLQKQIMAAQHSICNAL
jgi:hypothetical protein